MPSEMKVAPCYTLLTLLAPVMSLSYREFIECRYIGLFRISNSISYRTSHIEYLDILKTNDFFVFFRRKFQKFAENSENSPKIRRKFRKFAENSENSPKIPQKEGLLWGPHIVSYRIVSRKKPSYRIDIVSNRKKAYRYSMTACMTLSCNPHGVPWARPSSAGRGSILGYLGYLRKAFAHRRPYFSVLGMLKYRW